MLRDGEHVRELLRPQLLLREHLHQQQQEHRAVQQAASTDVLPSCSSCLCLLLLSKVKSEGHCTLSPAALRQQLLAPE
jgi:hypothetical protein